MSEHIYYKYIYYLAFVLITAFSLEILNCTPVLAAPDESGAMSQIPDGLPISEFFSIKNPLRPSVANGNYPYLYNSAKIASSNPRLLILAQGNYRNNDSSNRDGVYGAAWSNKNKENYFDISKKQTVSVWLYFGSGNGSQIENGEGMSLVLQNDPRVDSTGQSQALGAGFEGLGALGYDKSNYNQTTAFLSDVTLPTPEYVADTAVKNSIALNFDTDNNSASSATGINAKGPVKLYTNKSLLFPAIFNSDYSLGAFDSVDTGDIYGTKVSPNYPEYAALKAGRPQTDFPLRQGNAVGIFGSIALTYPGNPLTYQLTNLYLTNGDFKLFSNKGKAMAAIQAYPTTATLINGTDINKKNIYWHHVTFTWTPAKDANGKPTSDGMPVVDGTPAYINYDFNDKMPNGSTNTGNKYYSRKSDSIPVDPRQFNLPAGDTKVYWGLTGSNSNDANVYSKLAVFESIPALATAKATASVIDTDIQDSTGKDLTITDDVATDPERTVHNKDRLIFDYQLDFDEESSHQNWKNIISKIRLPITNVDFDNSATITYKNDAGKTAVETLPLLWGSGDNTDLISHQLEYHLGNYVDADNNPDQFTSATIQFTGTANNTTASTITVPAKPATFSGSNAIESTSSPQFFIDNTTGNKKLLQLTVSNNLDFQNFNHITTHLLIPRADPFTLNVTSKLTPWMLQASTKGLFLNGNGQQFNGNLVYKETSSSLPLLLTNTIQKIASDPTSYTNDHTDDLTQNWNQDSGILLQPTKSIDQAGKYSGQLDWILTNSLGD